MRLFIVSAAAGAICADGGWLPFGRDFRVRRSETSDFADAVWWDEYCGKESVVVKENELAGCGGTSLTMEIPPKPLPLMMLRFWLPVPPIVLPED
jgi:hypothetical protein